MRGIFATLVLLAACGTGELELSPAQTGIRIAGPDTLSAGLLPALADGYSRTRDVSVTIEEADNSASMRALLASEADLVATTRVAMPAEVEQGQVLDFDLGSTSSRHLLAVNVVAVSVHPSNATDSLTYDQIIAIFCTGTMGNWADLGLEDTKIYAVAPELHSGTRGLFEDFFCGPKGIHPSVRNVPPGDLTDALNHDPAAISIVSLSAPAGKVLGLRPDASGPPVRPSQQSVIRGSYPLYHDVYLHSAGAKNKAATDFLAWVISPAGQDLVDEQRFVPLFLRPERLDTPRPLRETIHFEVGEIKPNQRSSARIELLTGELQERAGEYHHIVLEGFTDTTEPNPTALSRARAEMVRDRLKTALPGLYFEIIPRGAMRPIAPNNTPYGRQRNRRVQIYLADEEAKGLGQGSETEEG